MHRYIRKSEYTYEEKKLILDYIIKTKCYSSLRGNVFWQEMEEKNIINRTWQSAKEHFKKKIIENIHTFPIPDLDRERIKEGWAASRAPAYKRQRTKRPRHAVENNFSDEGSEKTENFVISDGSDSETTKTRRENTRKNKKCTSSTRTHMPNNFFSDEEDEERKNYKRNEHVSSHHSPDLLNIGRDDQSTPDININQIITISDEENSNEVTIVPVEIDVETVLREEAAPFSLDEDMLLINFMKCDKTYLERKDRLDIYEYFQEIYPNSKHPELLRRRFLLHILPNICNYRKLSCNEMIKIYDDAHMKIPQNLINLLENADQHEDISAIHEENSPNNTLISACENSKVPAGDEIVQNSIEDTERNEEISVINEENNSPNNIRTAASEISKVSSGVKILQNSMRDTERNEEISVINAENNNMEVSQNLSNLMENADLNEGIVVINEENNRVEISLNLSNSLENADRSKEVSVIDEEKNSPNQSSTSTCKSTKIKCIYSHMFINDQSELFVSLPDYGGEDTDKILDLLSTKFQIPFDHIYYIEFHSVVLLDQIQHMRNVICRKLRSLTLQNMSPLNIAPDDIIASLETCLKTFDKFEDDIFSDSSSAESGQNTIDTQTFRPTEVSTPEKKSSGSVEQEIISEFLFRDLPEELLAEHNYSAELKIKSENVSIPDIYIKDEVVNERELSQDNSSQCLESVPSLNSSKVQQVLEKMVQSQIQNNLDDSEDCFCTPILNTQDL